MAETDNLPAWACVCGDWHRELGPLHSEFHHPADGVAAMLPNVLGVMGWD